MREYLPLLQFSRKTVVRALEVLWKSVVLKKLRDMVPKKFGIVTDGWDSPDGLHYFGDFVAFPKQPDEEECEFRLLQVSYQQQETSFSADMYIATLEKTLHDVINAKTDAVLFMLSDHASTMQCIADKLRVPFIGCQSHRLELGCAKIHAKPESMRIINHINKIMLIIKASIKFTSTLLSLTNLKPKIYNKAVIRWGKVEAVLKRYVQVKNDLPRMVDVVKNDKGAENLSTLEGLVHETANADFQEIVSDLVETWKPLGMARLKLQALQFPYALAPAIFAILLSEFEDDTKREWDTDMYFGHREDCTPTISHPTVTNGSLNRFFLSGIVKLYEDPHASLLRNEQIALAKFKRKEAVEKRNEGNDKTTEKPAWMVSMQNIKQHKGAVSAESPYHSVRWIPCTSNVVERLWSVLKLVIGYQRQRLSRNHLQMIACLKLNFDLWANDDSACHEALLANLEVDEQNDANDEEDDEEEEHNEEETMKLYHECFGKVTDPSAGGSKRARTSGSSSSSSSSSAGQEPEGHQSGRIRTPTSRYLDDYEC